MKKQLTSTIFALASFTSLASLFAPTAQAEDWGQVDKLADFVSLDRTEVLTNARSIEGRGLLATSLRTTPWSGTFWPDMAGSVAAPYADSKALFPFLTEFSWHYSRSLIGDRSAIQQSAFNGTASDQVVANLSPAEKYDLLLGDSNFTFTRSIFARVNQLDSLGLLNLKSLWSGICHGWGPASLYMDRPEHLFYAKAPSGRAIPFYPDDVKALQSIAWGDAFGPGGAQYFSKIEGYQCRSGARTDKYGRLTDPKCFDVNPAFFHLMAVNQIGLNQRGFIMDREYKTAVQNQPVFAYRYKYFRVNDRTGKTGISFDEAKVTTTALRFDPFRKHRSPRATAIVGVEATYWYGRDVAPGLDPSHAEHNGPENDKHATYTVRYDLELDSHDEIVGGEWREFKEADAQTLVEQTGYHHPDIVWLMPKTVKPFSIGDWDILEKGWDGTSAVPAEFIAASRKSSAWTEQQTINGQKVAKMYPQPLLTIVERLVELSRR